MRASPDRAADAFDGERIGSVFLLERRHRSGHRFWIPHNERPRSNAQNMVRRCARRSCHKIDVRPIGKNSLPPIDVKDASSIAREQTAQAEEERLDGGLVTGATT